MPCVKVWYRLCLLLLCTLAFSACSLLQINRSRVRGKYERAGLMAHDVELSSGKLHYYDGGSGPPVLLIHGFAFGALETWEGQVPEFARTHRVIAPDLFWFGQSVPKGAMDDAEKQARALSELLDRLGLGKIAIVGVSFGGYVALELGLRAPAHLGKLVLIDAAGLAPTAEESRTVTANFAGKQHIADLLIPQSAEELRMLLKTLFYKPHHIPTCILRQILREEFWQNRDAKRQICDNMEAAGGFLPPSELHELGAKTLLIWGRHDPLILPSIGARLAAAIPDSQILYFESSAHSPMIEETKRFNAEVLRFLAESP